MDDIKLLHWEGKTCRPSPCPSLWDMQTGGGGHQRFSHTIAVAIGEMPPLASLRTDLVAWWLTLCETLQCGMAKQVTSYSTPPPETDVATVPLAYHIAANDECAVISGSHLPDWTSAGGIKLQSIVFLCLHFLTLLAAKCLSFAECTSWKLETDGQICKIQTFPPFQGTSQMQNVPQPPYHIFSTPCHIWFAYRAPESTSRPARARQRSMGREHRSVCIA